MNKLIESFELNHIQKSTQEKAMELIELAIELGWAYREYDEIDRNFCITFDLEQK